MLFTVTVMHNITRQDGRVAVLARFTQNRLLPGDTLKVVGVLALPAASVTDAAERAFATANGAGPTRLADVYRAWGVRSMCVGDVLAIDPPTGRRCLLACTTTGWRPVNDPRAYTILPGHPPTTPVPGLTDAASDDISSTRPGRASTPAEATDQTLPIHVARPAAQDRDRADTDTGIDGDGGESS